MRENPWHIRYPSTEHYQWFKNLVDLHELTTHWIKEVQADRPSYLLTRGLSKEVSQNLWMLDSLSETPLEKLLDDTLPKEMLGRLEHTIWAVQSWTLSNLQERTTSSNRNSLDSLLEQVCWKLGKTSAETRWNQQCKKGNLPLREVMLSFNDSPLSGYPHSEGFLVRRAIQNEVQVELRFCPHQIPYPEVKAVADQLCHFHAQWMRGFAYALNHRTAVEHVVHSPRCFQRWFTT